MDLHNVQGNNGVYGFPIYPVSFLDEMHNIEMSEEYKN